MKPWSATALAFLITSGCATLDRPGPVAPPSPPPKGTPAAERSKPAFVDRARAQAPPPASLAAGAMAVAASPPAAAPEAKLASYVAPAPKPTSTPVPAPVPAPGPELGAIAALPTPEPGKAVEPPASPPEVEPARVDLTPAPVEPTPAPAPAPEPPAPVVAAAPEPAPVAAPMPGPSPSPAAAPSKAPAGRPVARVGDEVITLPALTDAVKRRLALLPPDSTPTRKLIIRTARSTLESLIETSLILQEARRQFPDPAGLGAALAEADGRWAEGEVPKIAAREHAASEGELRDRLARKAQSLDDLREMYRLRDLAGRMMRRDGSAGDLDASLAELRRRTPITSIMTPAQLAASQGDPLGGAGLGAGGGLGR